MPSADVGRAIMGLSSPRGINMLKPGFIALWMLMLSCAASAQPLVDVVPQDAIVYMGWRGADDPGEGYVDSHLKRLADEMDAGALFSSVLDAIRDNNPDDRDIAVTAELARTIGRVSWHRPTAAYLQPTPGEGFPMRWVMLWHVQGQEADQLSEAIQGALQQAPASVPIQVVKSAQQVQMVLGTPMSAEAGAPAKSIASSDRFKKAFEQVGAGGVLVVYVDGVGVVELIDSLVQVDARPDEVKTWSKVRGVLGLDGLHALAWSSGFDGPDWLSEMYIDAPAPRQGVLAMLDGEPITDQDLMVVPAEATWLMATRCDLGKLLDTVRLVLVETEPKAAEQFEAGLAQGSRMTGVDLETDLIRSLGSAWLAYTDPGATGSGIMGVTLVNPLNDPQKARQALISLQSLANAMMSQHGPGGHGGSGMNLRFHTTDHDGMTIHTLSIPFIGPSWSVHNGRLYVGLYPQTLHNVASRAQAEGSILDNQAYQQWRSRIDVGEPKSIMFTDLPSTAPASYQNLVSVSQTISGMLGMFGAQSPTALMPAYSKIEPLLSPSGHVAWVDDSGYRYRSISPFPGSMMLSPQGSANMATMTGPMMIGVMLPALGAARRTARQMKSATQCRGIVQSLVVYSNDNNDRYPNDIAVLYEDNFFAAEYALSPDSGIRIPVGFEQWDIARRSQWLRENASYVLIPDLMADINSETICVFERPDHVSRDDIAVGFNDGAAMVMDRHEARQRIEQQTGKTLEELIERQRAYQPAAD